MSTTPIRSSTQLYIDNDLDIHSHKIHSLAAGTMTGDAVEYSQMLTTIADAITGLGSNYASVDQTMYLGTTAIHINRQSSPLALTGITSIDGFSASATKLATTRTINGVGFDGTSNITITANVTNALTIGTGLLGNTYDGSVAKTIAIDTTYFDTRYQSSLGFTPENVANKVTSFSSPTNIQYPSALLVSTQLNTKFNTSDFTDTAVTSKLLTGLNITGGSIVSTDSILVAFGKLQNTISGLLGGAIFQSVWNANTNSPTLTSSIGTSGYYYIVNVAGTTNLNGITDWQVGDWAIFDGGLWRKVDNTDAVSSVNGYTGSVSLTKSDIGLSLVPNINTTNDYRSSNFIAGTNYEVPLTFSTGLSRTGNTITSNITSTQITAAFGSQIANQIFASPNGSAGTPSFRYLQAADIPSGVSAYIWNQTSQQSATINVSGNVTANQLISTTVNGNAPLLITSSTLVSNLNAQYLSGIDIGRIIYGDNTSGSYSAADFASIPAKSGFFRLPPVTTGLPNTGSGNVGIVSSSATASNYQVAFIGNTGAHRYLANYNNGTSWSTPVEFYHTGNFTPSNYSTVSNVSVPNTNIAIGNSSSNGLSYISGFYYNSGLYVPSSINATNVNVSGALTSSYALNLNGAPYTNLATILGNWAGSGSWGLGNDSTAGGHVLKFDQVAGQTFQGASDITLKLGTKTVIDSGSISSQSVNYANSAGTAGSISNFTVRVDRSDGNDYSLAGRGTGIYAIAGGGSNGPGAVYLNLLHMTNSSDVAFQIAGGYTSDNMYFRGTSNLAYGNSYTAWRTVIHSGNSTNYASGYVYNESANMRFHYSGQSGQPSWMWGGNTASDMYVYNPSNFSVNYASSAGVTNVIGGNETVIHNGIAGGNGAWINWRGSSGAGISQYYFGNGLSNGTMVGITALNVTATNRISATRYDLGTAITNLNTFYTSNDNSIQFAQYGVGTTGIPTFNGVAFDGFVMNFNWYSTNANSYGSQIAFGNDSAIGQEEIAFRGRDINGNQGAWKQIFHSGNIASLQTAFGTPWTSMGYVTNAIQDTVHSFSTNGYQKLSTGMIMQWGKATANNTVYFPVAFTTRVFFIGACNISNNNTEAFAITSLTLSSFYLNEYGKTNTGNWFAIGY